MMLPQLHSRCGFGDSLNYDVVAAVVAIAIAFVCNFMNSDYKL